MESLQMPLGHTAVPHAWLERLRERETVHPAARAMASAFRTSFFGCTGIDTIFQR